MLWEILIETSRSFTSRFATREPREITTNEANELEKRSERETLELKYEIEDVKMDCERVLSVNESDCVYACGRKRGGREPSTRDSKRVTDAVRAGR